MTHDKFAASAKPKPRLASREITRLRIWHLILWAFCSAVYLFLNRAIQSFPAGETSYRFQYLHGTTALHSVTVGAAWMGVLVLGYRLVHGARSVLMRPGHWLLLIQGVMSAALVPLMVIQLFSNDAAVTVFVLLTGGLYLATGVAYGFAARWTAILRWQVFLSVLALHTVMHTVTYVIYFFLRTDASGLPGLVNAMTTCGQMALGAWAIVVGLLDRASESPDWLHWLGIAVYSVNAFSAVLMLLYHLFRFAIW